jgi:hypothetical protein
LVAVDHVGEQEVVTRWTGIYGPAIDDLPYVYVTDIQPTAVNP